MQVLLLFSITAASIWCVCVCRTYASLCQFRNQRDQHKQRRAATDFAISSIRRARASISFASRRGNAGAQSFFTCSLVRTYVAFMFRALGRASRAVAMCLPGNVISVRFSPRISVSNTCRPHILLAKLAAYTECMVTMRAMRFRKPSPKCRTLDSGCLCVLCDDRR